MRRQAHPDWGRTRSTSDPGQRGGRGPVPAAHCVWGPHFWRLLSSSREDGKWRCREGPRPRCASPVPGFGDRAWGRGVTCVFAGTGPRICCVRWGPVPEAFGDRSQLWTGTGPRRRVRGTVPVGDRKRDRPPGAPPLGPQSRWCTVPNRLGLPVPCAVGTGPRGRQFWDRRLRSGPVRMTRSVISARREEMRSPRAVRRASVGRLVVMRVGRMCSYR